MVKKVTASPLLQLLRQELDYGEAEAICLAIKLKASLTLLDEKEARSIARNYNLSLTGVVGLLIRAKKENKITSLYQELQKLADKGFRIHPLLVREALHACGEVKR